MRFFLEIQGRAEGPFTVEQVEALHGSGRIDRSTRCRPEGSGEWSSVYNLVPTAIWVTSPVAEPVSLPSDPLPRQKITKQAIFIGASVLVALLLLIPVAGIVMEELGRKEQIEQTRYPAPSAFPNTLAPANANQLRDATAQLNQTLGAVVFLSLLFPVIAFVIGLFLFAFWLWMLIQVVTREPEGSDKIVWTLVVVFTGPIGATIYFFVRYLQRSH